MPSPVAAEHVASTPADSAMKGPTSYLPVTSAAHHVTSGDALASTLLPNDDIRFVADVQLPGTIREGAVRRATRGGGDLQVRLGRLVGVAVGG